MGGELGATGTPGQGSVFRVELFLPELHQAAQPGGLPWPPAPAAAMKARAALLVVDNEEADRDLLVHLLEPLG